MMKKLSSLRAAVLLLSVVSATSVQANGNLLNVGSKAPEIKVSKWVKGTPVKSFEKGKFYVVEFWATWCGPCKAAMPHLSELARKYKGQVTFTGVSVFERGEGTTQRVEAFVKSMGDKMDYNVCADGATAFMAQNWLQAAGEGGIPCTFVINGEGKVAWIGHPNGLEEVLPKVLAGTDDYSKLAKSREATKSGMAIDPAAARDIQIAIDAKDYAGTVKAINKVAATNPTVAKKFQAEKLRALMYTDEPKGLDFAKEILKSDPASAGTSLDLLKAGAMVATADNLSKKAYETAIELLTKVTELKPVAPEPGMMAMHVNVEAVKHLIQVTQTKIAALKP